MSASETSDLETGSWFPVPAESDPPAEVRGLFAKARERLGFVPSSACTRSGPRA